MWHESDSKKFIRNIILEAKCDDALCDASDIHSHINHDFITRLVDYGSMHSLPNVTLFLIMF